MAIYRNVRITFWSDPKVADDFTPEDRYFYLYLMTNPHTNLAGCYELSKKIASSETGYTVEVIEALLDRFEKVHGLIRYSSVSKEVLILNWAKFNWTSSEGFRKALRSEIDSVKSVEFKGFLEDLFDTDDTVAPPSSDGVGTTDTVTVTVSDTDNNTDTNTKSESVSKKDIKNEFEYLWKMYPKKQGKEKALGYYERARKNGTEFSVVDVGIKAYLDYIRANEIDMQYVKQGATFFSQKAWNDDWSYRSTKQNANPFMTMLETGDY